MNSVDSVLLLDKVFPVSDRWAGSTDCTTVDCCTIAKVAALTAVVFEDFGFLGELPSLTLGDLACPHLPFFGKGFLTFGDSFLAFFLPQQWHLLWAFMLTEEAMVCLDLGDELALVPRELPASLHEGEESRTTPTTQ